MAQLRMVRTYAGCYGRTLIWYKVYQEGLDGVHQDNNIVADYMEGFNMLVYFVNEMQGTH